MRLLPIPVCRAGYRGAYWALRGYWFVARPDVAGVKCVLTDGDRVLLVRHTYGHRGWDLPGGAVRRREDPEVAARREMSEELGVTVTDWTKLGQIRARIDYRRDTMYLFAADIGPRELRLDRCELAEARWFARDALPDGLGRFTERIMAVVPG